MSRVHESAALGVAVACPTDWAVHEDALPSRLTLAPGPAHTLWAVELAVISADRPASAAHALRLRALRHAPVASTPVTVA